MVLAKFAMLVKKEADGIIDETVNKKQNRYAYQANMNELVGCISRHFPEYMEADTRDKKGCGESNSRKKPRNVIHHYNNKATH